MKRRNESGNALWFILIAVALMAALTATLTGSSDTTEQSGNIEQLRVQAGEVMRFVSGVEQTMRRMQMRGYSESDFSFEHDDDLTTFLNPKCTDDGCHMFLSTGAGIGYKYPSTQWLSGKYSSRDTYGQWEFTGANNVEGVETNDSDLVMFLGFLKKPLCEELNIMLGHSFSEAIPDDDDGISVTPYVGSFPAEGVINGAAGKKSACIRSVAGGNSEREYMFYHVLVAR
jgi:hypothetical protein